MKSFLIIEQSNLPSFPWGNLARLLDSPLPFENRLDLLGGLDLSISPDDKSNQTATLGSFPDFSLSDPPHLISEMGVTPKEVGSSSSLASLDLNVPDTTALILNARNQTVGEVQQLLGKALENFSSDFPLTLDELENAVQVEREPSGVVHIQADNENDLFLTLGFVHANDRLFQMDLQRRTAAGEVAEILGASALEQDVLQRTLGLYQAAESAYQNLDAETRQIVDAYTEGINAFLELNSPLPFEFQLLDYEPEPWQPADVLAALKLQSFTLSLNLESELFRAELLSQGLTIERIQELFPPNDDEFTILQPEDIDDLGLPTTVDGSNSSALLDLSDLNLEGLETSVDLSQSFVPTASGSNNWVVSGERTTTGKPLLANDPHFGMSLPSLWHTVHLESPGFEAIGASIPGVPGIAVGHNNQIAWGITNSFVDVQDLYVLPPEFQVTDSRQETIQVRGADDVVIPVQESALGPVLSGALGLDAPIALRWVGLGETDGTLESFLGINQAQNWEDFTTALESYVAPSQNFVYADVEGNIGYITPGQIPIRPLGLTGTVPVPTSELLSSGLVSELEDLDWQGLIPFDQLPQVLNPERGYIITANQRIAPDEYPFFLGTEYAEPYRAQRIQELIESEDTLSLADMQAIQLDQVSLLFRDFVPVLEAIEPILEDLEPHPSRALRWLDRLLEWDGNVSPDSRQATVFETWYTQLTQIPAAEIGLEVLDGRPAEPAPRFLLQAFTEGDPACGGSEAACLETAAQIFQEVVASFEGSVPRWGDIHLATFTHPVLPLERQVPFGGDRYTVNVGTYDPETFLFDTNGANYRQIVDLSNLENSVFIQAPGQSGRPFSPFFDNLLPLWQRGAYLPLQTQDFPVALEATLEPTGDSLLGAGPTRLSDRYDPLLAPGRRNLELTDALASSGYGGNQGVFEMSQDQSLDDELIELMIAEGLTMPPSISEDEKDLSVSLNSGIDDFAAFPDSRGSAHFSQNLATTFVSPLSTDDSSSNLATANQLETYEPISI